MQLTEYVSLENRTNNAAPRETISDDNDIKNINKHHKSHLFLFRGIFQTNLRHPIRLRHCEASLRVPTEDQDECFEQMRKAGILKFNKEEMQKVKTGG